MPVEIMELIIKAKVGDQRGNTAGNNQPVQPGNVNGTNGSENDTMTEQQVLEIINRKKER